MAQRIARPAISPLADDLTVRNVFADSCAGLNVLNGNVHITFASVVADYSQEGVPSRRLVSARVVMPVVGAAELRDLLKQLLEMLAAQGVSVPEASASTVVTPLKRPS